MKSSHTKNQRHSRLVKWSTAFILAGSLFGAANTFATNYPGNGDSGFGGPIGKGTLSLTDDGTNISGTLSLGVGGTLNDCLVIYIDTGAGSGIADTSGLTDQQDGNRKSICGVSGGSRTVMTFMTGFRPQYAIAMAPTATGFGGLWALDVPANLTFKASVNESPNNNVGPYTFSFPASSIGLIPGSKATIKIFGTLTSTTAYRSTEAIAGNDSGVQGVNPFTQTAMATYTFDAGAPVLTPVTFKVDMTQQIALGSFNPGGGDKVYAAGSFETFPWSGFQLTAGSGTNANIYTGTYLDADPTNTAEQFKFYEVSVSGGTTNWEGLDNRPFTLTGGGQILSLVYFNDQYPANSATTNAITFQVDMTDQILLGQFDPSTETVQSFGTFESPQWSAGFTLTNNPAGANTNLYTGTYLDGNYPGSFENFKFVVIQNGNNIYESINNRDFFTPNGATTFPVMYFNNVSNVVTVPVTFRVDMTSQVEAGNVNPGAGMVPGVSGSFQNPGYSGAPLTNTPIGGNTNIWSGTFNITAQAGTVFQYKFVINNNGTLNYENPSSTDGNNRIFTTTSSAETLPLVYWSDLDPANILPAATLVTFTVDMNGAIDSTGVPFDPSQDTVLINGTLPPSGQFVGAYWTDPFPTYDYPAIQMVETGTSTLYTGSFTIPAGSPLEVDYKYGIYHGAASFTINANCDNEAGFALNHVRFIRATGTYVMPTDIFGQQRTNLTAADEISFGNLSASSTTPGTVSLNWLGRPGVYVQVNTNLATTNWVTIPNSGRGISATNIPASGTQGYYRLLNP